MHPLDENVGRHLPAPQKEFLPRMGAGCVVFLGSLITLGAIGGVIQAGREIPSIGPFFMIAIGLGLVVAGFFWIRYIIGFERRRRHLFEEKSVLAAAVLHGGTVTLAQVMLHTPLSSSEVEAVMARLCREGLAHAELDPEEESVCYRFHGLVRRGTDPRL